MQKKIQESNDKLSENNVKNSNKENDNTVKKSQQIITKSKPQISQNSHINDLNQIMHEQKIKVAPKPQVKIKSKQQTITKKKIVAKKSIKNVVKKEVKSINKKISIIGIVSLDNSGVKDKDAKITDVIAYFVPDVIPQINKVFKNKEFTIATQNKRFVPNVLVVPKGSTVNFPNMDRILHNVFSVSKNSKFDLGLYSAGKQKSVTFDNAGVIYVHCNVHHSMQADILVVDTPYYSHAMGSGEFSIELPSLSTGKLYIWHPRSQLKTINISNLTDIAGIDLTLPIIRAKIPKHLNKLGSPYRKRRKN